MTNTGVHLTQLITESVKVSIHALTLCHDSLKSHTTTRRRRSGGGRSRKGWKISHLRPRPLRSKLDLTSSNWNCVYDTHDQKKKRGIRDLNQEVSRYMRDSRRKDKLITCSCIPINIDDQCDEGRREVYGEVLKKGSKNQAENSVMEL